MIIANGVIGIGFAPRDYCDSNGFPVAGKAITTYTEFPCQIVQESSQPVKAGGEVQQERHFAVYVEKSIYFSDRLNTICGNGSVRLRDSIDVIGDFPVISVENLDAVNQIRIQV